MSQLSLATLNTWGVPILGPRLRQRYRTIAEEFEASEVEVVNLQ